MAQLNTSSYASRTKELLGLVNQLHALGAQGDIDLPRITVIGNQSAGKSSVVEAISGINVPRDAGTCTRCPMECRLSSSLGPWQCRISIRREYDKHKRLDDIREIPFGDLITDKSEVELALRRAQLAVLNPSIPIPKILKSSVEELNDWSTQSAHQVPFSRNVVCVDLEGPDLTDLSFIDLPGLIANADNEIVQLVEDMVISHITGNCLILVALPMTDDIENQKALKLAKTADPRGQRTIGVLTKPDMLSAGSTKALDLWLNVIEGRRHPLTHGYYCTRQPDDQDRSEKISATAAREAEKRFFSNTTPWSKSSRKERFGTENLISSLSHLLVSIIDATLPKICNDAQKALADCRRDLASLPPAVHDEPATHVLKLITEFASEVKSVIKGRSDASTLIQENRAAFRSLKTSIRSCAPNFVPALRTEVQPASILSLDDEDDDMRLVSEKPGSRFTLTDMREHINRSMTRELPNNVPFEAKAALILKFQDTWPEATATCFTRVETNLARVLFKYTEDNFSRYAVLHGHMKTFLAELLARRRAMCQQILESTLETERTPFTQNTHYLEATTEKWLANTAVGAGSQQSPFIIDSPATGGNPKPPTGPFAPFVQAFGGQQPASATSFTFVAPQSAFPPQQQASGSSSQTGFTAPWAKPPPTEQDVEVVQAALAALAAIGYHYEVELKVMADVRGYFQRVIDMVPQFIDQVFLIKFAEELQSFLIEKFGLGTATASDKCARYLAEDGVIVARREELLGKGGGSTVFGISEDS
ncbi:P-loop containing nucleoside triphosphate hydrolase protein [Mucidula mucida]|nr:P-loop containing nucleoside triphosphate hydrolase protein [Mucidula mucida]